LLEQFWSSFHFFSWTAAEYSTIGSTTVLRRESTCFRSCSGRLAF